MATTVTYIETFKKNLIATKRLEFKDKLKSSEKVAEAAAIAHTLPKIHNPND